MIGPVEAALAGEVSSGVVQNVDVVPPMMTSGFDAKSWVIFVGQV